MTSILKLSGTNDSKDAVSPDLVKKPQDLGSEWDRLRGLTESAYQKQPSTRLRTMLLAVLLLVALSSLGLLLHNHMPALVNFGEELSEAVQQFAAASPTPSTATRGPALPDLRSVRHRSRSSDVRVPDSQPDQAYDPAFHPFYATAVIGDRHVSLVSNNNIIVLDVAGGTWKYGSELE